MTAMVLKDEMLDFNQQIHFSIDGNGAASFPGHRRNSLATSVISNCYFHCQKVGSTKFQNIVT